MKQTERFVMIPKWLFDIELSPSAIAVYAALRFYRNDDNGRCDPSYTSVGAKVGLSHDRTEKYVKELENAHAVRVVRRLGIPNQHDFPEAGTLRENAGGDSKDPTHYPTHNPTHICVTNENNENNQAEVPPKAPKGREGEPTNPRLECARRLRKMQKANRRRFAARHSPR